MAQDLVMVVDDDESIREAVREMLDELGEYDIATADDGATALGRLSAGNVELLLIDLMMPNIDGYEILSRIRNGVIPRPGRIVVMSAHADPGAREGIIAMGADDFLPKPFNLSQLESAIEES